MQHTEDVLRTASDTKGETRKRSDEAMSDELAWIDQVVRLMQPVPSR